MPRSLILIALLVLVACVACMPIRAIRAPMRVLFVGNSLTYVGNLPAVLDALAAVEKRAIRSDMIVKGGSTLTDHLADGSVEHALAENHYDYVVLQERGGDVLCAFGPESCANSLASLGALAHIAAAHGAKPIFLGTYQTLPQVSKKLVEAETAAAMQLPIPYVAVSNRVQAGLAAAHADDWLYADGMHPGHRLVLLEAMLVYRQLFGTLPGQTAFSVHAPMYKPNAKFPAHSIVRSNATPREAAIPYVYTADAVNAVWDVADGSTPAAY